MKNYSKSIFKALLATILYVIIIETLGIWSLIAETIGLNYLTIYTFIQGGLQLITVLIFSFLVFGKRFNNLIKQANYKWYSLAMILGICFIPIQTPLNWIYNFLFDSSYYIDYDINGLSKYSKNAILNLVSMILFIPIAEELFFRRYIQGYLFKQSCPGIAILGTSILFALIHIPYLMLFIPELARDGHLAYIAFFGGLISGLLYHKSKSVGPSIIFHIFWNLTAIIV